MSHLFAKLKPKIGGIIVNVQTVPQKRNELLSLITRLENKFYKTQANSPRSNQNNHSFFFEKTEKRKIPFISEKNRHRNNNRG